MKAEIIVVKDNKLKFVEQKPQSKKKEKRVKDLY